MNYRTREAVFIKSNQSQHQIQDFRATNQNAGFEFMLDLLKISAASIYISQKQLPRRMESHLVIVAYTGYIFWQLFL